MRWPRRQNRSARGQLGRRSARAYKWSDCCRRQNGLGQIWDYLLALVLNTSHKTNLQCWATADVKLPNDFCQKFWQINSMLWILDTLISIGYIKNHYVNHVPLFDTMRVGGYLLPPLADLSLKIGNNSVFYQNQSSHRLPLGPLPKAYDDTLCQHQEKVFSR